MPDYILSFDPGGTTGSTIFRPDGNVWLVHEHSFGLFLPWVDGLLESWWRSGLDIEVVGERFTILPDTHKKTQTGIHQAIETIGVMRYLAAKWGAKFEEQSVFSAGQLAEKDRLLHRIGWWQTQFGDDGRSAQRHMITYLMRRHPDIFAKLVHPVR